MAQNPGESPLGVQGSLESFWGNADQLDLVFVDNIHVQRINDQFYLTFGQVRPPVEIPPSRMVAEIRPVARLVVPRDALTKIVELLGRLTKDGG